MDGQESGVLVAGPGRISRLPGHVGQVATAGQGAGVLGPLDPLTNGQASSRARDMGTGPRIGGRRPGWYRDRRCGSPAAAGPSFNRFSGTLENGDGIGPWVRYTAGFRKIDGNWLIAHDQVSVPVDFGSGRALVNLEP
jgi:hypothetical protein